MAINSQLVFCLPRHIKVAYGHSPEAMAEQLEAMQRVADVRGYMLESSVTHSDGIWWVTTVSFVPITKRDWSECEKPE